MANLWKTDGGKNAVWEKEPGKYVIMLGAYLFGKHGASTNMPGARIVGWNSIDDVYKFIMGTPFQFNPGFAWHDIKPDFNKLYGKKDVKHFDTVIELTPEKLAEINRNPTGKLAMMGKNNFQLPGLPENMAPVLKGAGPVPTNRFRMLTIGTNYEESAKDEDMRGNPELLDLMKKLGNVPMTVMATIFTGKDAAPGNKPGKEQWVHPVADGQVEGKFVFSQPQGANLQPWPSTPMPGAATDQAKETMSPMPSPANTPEPGAGTAAGQKPKMPGEGLGKMASIVKRLDDIAEILERKGQLREASTIDMISNTLEKL